MTSLKVLFKNIRTMREKSTEDVISISKDAASHPPLNLRWQKNWQLLLRNKSEKLRACSSLHYEMLCAVSAQIVNCGDL